MTNNLFPAFILGFLSGLVAAVVIGWRQQPTGGHDAYMDAEYKQVVMEVWIDGIEEEILRQSI